MTPPAGWEVHALPSGAHVYYRDSDHSYWGEIAEAPGEWRGVRAARLTGVTTLVKPFDWRPDGLMDWAARLAREGVDWRDERDAGADRGTRAHEHAFHALAQGEPVPAFDEMPADERGYARAVMRWWIDTGPRVIATEFIVADVELGVAGRPDLLCELPDGRVAIVDLKTSRYLSATFVAQVNCYARLAVTSGYAGADVCVLVQAGEDGSVSVVEVAPDPEDLVRALGVYRRANEISSGICKQLKAAV